MRLAGPFILCRWIITLVGEKSQSSLQTDMLFCFGVVLSNPVSVQLISLTMEFIPTLLLQPLLNTWKMFSMLIGFSGHQRWDLGKCLKKLQTEIPTRKSFLKPLKSKFGAFAADMTLLPMEHF